MFIKNSRKLRRKDLNKAANINNNYLTLPLMIEKNLVLKNNTTKTKLTIYAHNHLHHDAYTQTAIRNCVFRTSICVKTRNCYNGHHSYTFICTCNNYSVQMQCNGLPQSGSSVQTTLVTTANLHQLIIYRYNC